MSVWLKNGKAVVLSGAVVNCDYCPCDTPSDSSGSTSSGSQCDCGTADWVYSAHPLNRWSLVTNNCTGGGTPVEPNYTPTGAPWTATTCCEGCGSSGSSGSGSSGSQIQCDDPCPQGMPTTLTATLVNVDNCSCYDGMTVSLIWDDLQNAWVGDAAGCAVDSCFFRITVQCDGILINNGFVVSIEGCTSSFGQNLLAECGPFEIQGNFTIDAGTSPCCGCGPDGRGGGTIQITVTE